MSRFILPNKYNDPSLESRENLICLDYMWKQPYRGSNRSFGECSTSPWCKHALCIAICVVSFAIGYEQTWLTQLWQHKSSSIYPANMYCNFLCCGNIFRHGM